MKILITGATGLLGSALGPALRDAGHEVRALVRFTSRTELQDLRGIETVHGNVMEPASLVDAVRGVDAVVHAAAAILGRDEESLRRVNVDGTYALLDAMTRADEGTRLVHVSSIAAGGFGTSSHPLDERMSPRPATHYGRTKLEAEELVREHGRRRPVTVLRFCTLYGPRDRFFPLLYRLIGLGLTPVLDDGELSMSLLHVSDAARAVMTVLGRDGPSPRPVWYVSSDAAVSWRRFCGVIESALGRRMSVPIPLPRGLLNRAEPLLERLADLPPAMEDRIPAGLCADLVRLLTGSGLVCDSTAFARATGWRPTVDIEDGVRETVRWHREHDLL
jgi:nucleoside-diphosphate-sugar epimerase